MGCHTWFYKKLEVQPSYDEVKKYYLTVIDANVKLANEMIDGTLDPVLAEAYPEWDKNEGQRILSIYERIKRIVEKDLCKVAVCNRYRHGDDSTCYIEEKGFFVYTHDLPHDVFRIGDYPTNLLFSMDETLEFVSENHSKIHSYSDNWRATLEKFWKENEDGMIHFG